MPTLAPALAATLVDIAAAMAGARRPWWIIAGAAAALHHVGEAADVDVLLSLDDVPDLTARLALTPGKAAPHPRFRSSWFATWPGASLPVEFMADFSVCDGEAWRRIEPATRAFVAVRSCQLPVPARGELAAMLRGFGRPKDLRRAALLDG